MPETRSSATDQEMSQTTLNKGQRQMDSVLKSWGFRTSRDPFQENSSQGLEANKGQKSTPLREVVCPLERKAPTSTTRLERDHSLVRDVPRADRLLCPSGAHCAHSGNRSNHLGLAGPSSLHRCYRGFLIALGQDLERSLGPLRAKKPKVPHALVRRIWSDPSSIDYLDVSPRGITDRPTVDRGAVATRFFDVLTARVFQEKKP